MTEKPEGNGWGWRSAWIAVAISLYVLSIGPAGWLVNATGQRWIFLFYTPLVLIASIASPIEHALDWYVNLWLQL